MAYPVRSTSKVLKMSFVVNGGSTCTLSIPDAKDDLTKSQIVTLMSDMIDDNVILYNNNEATEAKDAYIVETTKYDLS